MAQQDSTSKTDAANGIQSPGVPTYTLAEGRHHCQPCADPTTVLRIRTNRGAGGLAVLSDTQLIETLAHFARERIPERSVHAKAAGAFGEFEVTHDVSDLTDASFLSSIGKKTKVLARISTVAGEKGSSDTVRDVRGFAVKFYTEEGNQDFVMNDLPVFFVRDPIKFPSLNRSHKRHPRTNVPDWSMFWDFHTNNQEGTHCLMHLFGQRGIPKSLAHVNAFSVHTYTLDKQDGSFVYVKWHFKPEGGIETLPSDVAMRLAGEEPDYHVKDLFNAIEDGNFPSWIVYVQVMRPEEVDAAHIIAHPHIDIFDDTFTWPHEQYPLRPVGRLTLNQNPNNYFQDIEQAAFSPSNMVPGIGPSADMMLQARMFSYPDAARYRVGPNYQQLPPNLPISKVYSPYQRDGPATVNGNYGADPNYDRSKFKAIAFSRHHQAATHEHWNGNVIAYTTEVTEKDFEQPRQLWKLICQEKDGKKQFLTNIVPTLSAVTEDQLRKDAIAMFARVDKDLGALLQSACENFVAGRQLM